MTKYEYEVGFYNIQQERMRVIDGSMLKNQKDRTLLYGYTCDRLTWHVYIKDGIIHKVKYGNSWDSDEYMSVTEFSVTENEQYVPDKRLYPECCDFEFCGLLKKKGICLPFTIFNEDKEEKQFYGEIL